MVIHNVSAVCGCTVPSWPKTPIRPNKKGNIEVTLKTKGIKGFFLKQFFVESNSDQDGIILLKIKGEIK
ncbi:MAG: DUF1573 domain-containing protein [Bacteroides sp.]|nr:DUF1573 domain-containing protein [Bacteroides sp.]